tara:strand:- start:497 stop:1384 length:888 start_codon:yes stop_codon:yes gene_type:complete
MQHLVRLGLLELTNVHHQIHLQHIDEDPMGVYMATTTCIRALLHVCECATSHDRLVVVSALCAIAYSHKTDEPINVTALGIRLMMEIAHDDFETVQHIQHTYSQLHPAMSARIIELASNNMTWMLVERNIGVLVEWKAEALRLSGKLKQNDAMSILANVHYFHRLAAENQDWDVLADVVKTVDNHIDRVADAFVLVCWAMLYDDPALAVRNTLRYQFNQCNVVRASILLVRNARARMNWSWSTNNLSRNNSHTQNNVKTKMRLQAAESALTNWSLHCMCETPKTADYKRRSPRLR